MFELSINNIVTVSRGDSFECPLFLNQGTDVSPIRHILKRAIEDGQVVNQEYVVFALLRPNQCFENAVVRKTFNTESLNDNGDVVIKFNSEDTIHLCPGDYYYEIRAYLFETDVINELDNDIPVEYIKGTLVNTVVERTKFIIL